MNELLDRLDADYEPGSADVLRAVTAANVTLPRWGRNALTPRSDIRRMYFHISGRHLTVGSECADWMRHQRDVLKVYHRTLHALLSTCAWYAARGLYRNPPYPVRPKHDLQLWGTARSHSHIHSIARASSLGNHHLSRRSFTTLPLSPIDPLHCTSMLQSAHRLSSMAGTYLTANAATQLLITNSTAPPRSPTTALCTTLDCRRLDVRLDADVCMRVSREPRSFYPRYASFPLTRPRCSP